MTLFDVGKDQLDRSSPEPNKHDQIISSAVKTHGTTSVNIITDATDPALTATSPLNPGFLQLIQSGQVTVTLPLSYTAGQVYAQSITLVQAGRQLAYVVYVQPPRFSPSFFYYTYMTPFQARSYNGTTDRFETIATAYVNTNSESAATSAAQQMTFNVAAYSLGGGTYNGDWIFTYYVYTQTATS